MQRGLLLPRATEWFAGIAAGAVYRISNAMLGTGLYGEVGQCILARGFICRRNTVAFGVRVRFCSLIDTDVEGARCVERRELSVMPGVFPAF